MNARRLLRNIAGWVLALIIIFFLFKIIQDNREQLSRWEWQISWPKAVISAVLLFSAYVTASQAWRSIIRGFGHRVSIPEAFRIIFLANLGRYIPGKIWQVFGMIGLARQLGIPARTSLASFVLVQGYMLPASFLLIPLFLGNISSYKPLEVYREVFYLIAAVILIIFLFLFFRPRGLNRALNWILRITRQEPVDYRPSMKNRMSIFIWYALTWILFGLAFYMFTAALTSRTDLPAVYLSGVYIASYVFGYISFISPGGLGVREGVMVALLTPLFGAPVAAALSFINRIWITIAEIIISLLALLTFKLKKDMPSSGTE